MYIEFLFHQDQQVVVELPESLASEEDEKIIPHESYVIKPSIAPATPRIFALSSSSVLEIETPSSSVSIQSQPAAASVLVASSSVIQYVAPVAKNEEETPESEQPHTTPPTPINKIALGQQGDESDLPNVTPQSPPEKHLENPLSSGNVEKSEEKEKR